MTKPKTETLEEYLARGGKIKYPKVLYPLPSRSFKLWGSEQDKKPAHGTHARYSNYKCRCEMCKEANRTYHRNYYRNVNDIPEEKFKGEYSRKDAKCPA